VPDRLRCDDVSSSDLISRYVSGAASEEEAEALEAHSLECDACGADLEAAMDLRAVMVKSPDAYRPRDPEASTSRAVPSAWPRRWIALAGIAAMLVFAVAIGREWQRSRDTETRLRGPDDAFALQMAWQPDGSLRVSWPAHTGAAIYRVRLVSPTADAVSEQVSITSVSFRADTVQRLPSAHVEVQAENLAGEVLARSERVPVPVR